MIILFTWILMACRVSDKDSTVPTDGEELMPQVCVETSTEEGGCECSSEEGFTTYQFTQGEYERCFTTYADPQTAGERLPLIIEPDSYTTNALVPADGVRTFASRYNVRRLDLTSPTGNWDFPLDNRVNDDNYTTQCDAENSLEIEYLEGVFAVVDQMIEDGLVDEDKVYLAGFSQGSVFTLFAATCFPDRIAGISQGGAGMFSQVDGSYALPLCEGACDQVAFQEYGADCVTEEPCDDCSYFPVYPTSDADGNTYQSCIFMYDNDEAAHSTAVPAHKYITQAGHLSTLRIFESRPEFQLGGHDYPQLGWEWVNSCLGVNPSCSSACEEAVVSCINEFKVDFENSNGQDPLNTWQGRDAITETYDECLINNASCTHACAATEAMLHSVQVPVCVCLPGQTDCNCTTSHVPGACNGQ